MVGIQERKRQHHLPRPDEPVKPNPFHTRRRNKIIALCEKPLTIRSLDPIIVADAPGEPDSVLVFPTFHKMESLSSSDAVMPPSQDVRGRQISSGGTPACFNIAGEKTARIDTLGALITKDKGRLASVSRLKL